MDRFPSGELGEQPQGQVLFITQQGRKQLAVETENWERISGVIGRVLRLEQRNSHDFLDFSNGFESTRTLRTKRGGSRIRH